MVFPACCTGICTRCLKNQQFIRERFCVACGRDRRRARRCCRCGTPIRAAYVPIYSCLCDDCAPLIQAMIRETSAERRRLSHRPAVQISPGQMAQIDRGVAETERRRASEERAAWEAIMNDLPGIDEIAPDGGYLAGRASPIARAGSLPPAIGNP